MNGQAPQALRVLLVDADPAVQAQAGHALRAAGMVLTVAADAATALQHFSPDSFDVVLLDLDASAPSGVALCAQLRAADGVGRLPLYVMTASEDRQTIEQAYEAGASDFVRKPAPWGVMPYRLRTAIDIHRALREAQRQHHLMAHAQRLAQLGSWEWQRADARLKCSAEMLRILGVGIDQMPQTLFELALHVHLDDRERVRSTFLQALRERRAYAVEYRVCRPDGSERRVYEQSDVELDASGRAETVRGIMMDVTERVAADARIRTLAYYDALTGLANRTLFREMMQQWLPYATRRNLRCAVLVVDLDRFKHINETLGSAVADEVLQRVGDRLRECVRVSDLKGLRAPGHDEEPVARLGGDEFTVLLVDIGDPDQALRVAQRITEALARPLHVNTHVNSPVGTHELALSCSVGVAMAPQDGMEPDALISHASTAMRVAKAAGRDQVRFYDGAMGVQVHRRLTIENELKRAIDAGELRLFYQAKVDMHERRIIGAEALMRWQHPQRGLVGPGDFIPVAEESGLIVPMTHWAVRQVCAQQARWRAAGLTPVPVSVNLAAASLLGDELALTVGQALQKHGLPAALLEFEVTESSLMADWERAAHVLQQLKALGLKLSIDDFGTGYSSLTYLKRFPVDVLKIDRSFIMDLASDANDAALTAAIIAMGSSLKLELVAEGVETAEQARFLMRQGCAVAQGFLFARPVPEAEFALLLEHGLSDSRLAPLLFPGEAGP